MIRLAASRGTLLTILPLTAFAATAEANTGWSTTVTVAPQAAGISTSALPNAPKGPGIAAFKSTHALEGIASYYWQDQMTANGERFDKTQLTAAHRTLPFGTRVKVTNLTNGRSVVVRINDRGPFKAGRIIDLSEAAAKHIDMTSKGLVRVALDVMR